MALAAYSEDDPSDEITIVPAGQADQKVMDGPIERSRREDLQQWDFLRYAAFSDRLAHPIASGPGGDPPDRIWKVGDLSWGVELTELTLENVRAGTARVRQVSRNLQRILDDDTSERFAHLADRLVILKDINYRRVSVRRSRLIGYCRARRECSCR